MILILLIPLFIFYVVALWVAMTMIVNSYIVPFLGLWETFKMSILSGIIIVIVLTFFYFLFFWKRLEGNRFKEFLSKSNKL